MSRLSIKKAVSVVRVPVSRIRGMIESGEIRDAKTIAALLMAC